MNVRVARIGGIDIELHYSWFVVFFLLAYLLMSQYFPVNFPGLTFAQYALLGLLSSLGLFVSVLLHELCHAGVAKHFRLGIHRITLFFFGGVAQVHEEHITPEKEFFMALVGPLFSIGLGAFCLLLLALELPVLVTAVLHYLGRINLVLGIFNLVPGFPLDGGRVLRACLWYFSQDFEKATWYASRGGKLFGVILAVMGGMSLFGGNAGGIWFILIGGFLYVMAEVSFEQAVVKSILEKVLVKEVVNKNFPVLTPSMSLELAAARFLIVNEDALPVVSKGKVLGVVTVEHLGSVPHGKRKKLYVSDVMESSQSIRPSDSADKAFTKMMAGNRSLLPVVEKSFLGVVTKSQLLHRLRLNHLK